MHVLQHDGCSQSELLKKNQITLKSKMDQQHGQLKEIQKGLNSLSSNADTHYIAKNFTNLKVFIFFWSHYNLTCFIFSFYFIIFF
jgi:hypothetical protein